MAALLGKFFPKKPINEPMLDLADVRWRELEGGYLGSTCDASVLLRQLETASSPHEANHIYEKLWDELHHQGDVSIASYYAVPHLVRIALETKLINYNVFGLVTLIEVQRHKGFAPLPEALTPNYQQAISDLSKLAQQIIAQEWDLSLTSSCLAAIALAKGQRKLANAILSLDSDDVIDEFLENGY